MVAKVAKRPAANAMHVPVWSRGEQRKEYQRQWRERNKTVKGSSVKPYNLFVQHCAAQGSSGNDYVATAASWNALTEDERAIWSDRAHVQNAASSQEVVSVLEEEVAAPTPRPCAEELDAGVFSNSYTQGGIVVHAADFTADTSAAYLGRGSFGTVYKIVHQRSLQVEVLP